MRYMYFFRFSLIRVEHQKNVKSGILIDNMSAGI